MSYFYDIFVSSYVDEKQDTDIDQKWISNLLYFLNTLLGARMSKKPTVVTSSDFREDGIFYGKPKTEVLEKVALFIVVISEKYQNNDDSLAELELFIKLNPETELNTRILKIFKDKDSVDNLPISLLMCLKYNFFIKNTFSENLDEELIYFDIMQDVFWLRLVDLAYDLDAMLKNLGTENFNFYLGKTVYLAETTADQQENIESIKRELVRHGFKILPDKQLSNDPWQMRTEVLGYLGSSTLSVHLIGNEYGDLLKNSEFSVVDLQNKIAADYFTKLENLGANKREQPFARLIWINPNTKQISPVQRKFIEELKNDDKQVKGADVMEVPIEILKSTIHEKTNRINEIKKQEEIYENFELERDQKKIYFIHEKEVTFNCGLLQKWLQNNDFAFEELSWNGTQLEQIVDHQRKIIQNDFILIYNSGSNIDWLKSKVYDLVKISGFERKMPHKGKAIYSDVDLSDFDQYLSRVNILRLDQTGGIEMKLQPFIDKINGD